MENLLHHLNDVAVQQRNAAGVFLEEGQHLAGQRHVIATFLFQKTALFRPR